MSKPTHIIIPIKDIDSLLDDAKAALDISRDRKNREFLNGRINILENILNTPETAKQISLDEKDIEEKANEMWDTEHVQTPTYRNGYKQALKDLL